MIYRLINLTFGLKANKVDDFPAPGQLAQGVYDGLPKEWFDFQDDDDYMIEDIMTSDGLNHEEIRLKATIGIRDHQIEVLAAEFKQEKKLTKHLDKEIAQQDTAIVNLEAQVENLVEKNNSQAVIIMSAQAELRTLQEKYDASLHDWTVVVAERNAADEELGDTQEEMKHIKGDLKSCQEANRKYQGERKIENGVNEEMVQKILDALVGAGFDAGGWGDDKEIEELEIASTQIEDHLKAVQTNLVTLTRFLTDAQDEVGNVSMSVDDASVEQDGLDQLLDHIRTVR